MGSYGHDVHGAQGRGYLRQGRQAISDAFDAAHALSVMQGVSAEPGRSALQQLTRDLVAEAVRRELTDEQIRAALPHVELDELARVRRRLAERPDVEGLADHLVVPVGRRALHTAVEVIRVVLADPERAGELEQVLDALAEDRSVPVVHRDIQQIIDRLEARQSTPDAEFITQRKAELERAISGTHNAHEIKRLIDQLRYALSLIERERPLRSDEHLRWADTLRDAIGAPARA